MGKPKTEPKFKDNQAGATAKFVRVPPRKARLVMDAVRGKYVGDALALLKFVPNFAARAIEKVIESAVANAENSRPVSEATGKPLPPLVRENLRLVRGFIDEGPRIKRLQPRAQGRAYRILKRMCHISVIVEEVGPKPRPVRRPAVRRAQAAGRPAVAAPAAPAAAPATAVETTAPEAVVEPVVEPTPAPEEKAE
jgi:large subunit ribosomal protein L22